MSASTNGCSEYLTYGLNFFNESNPIFLPIVSKFFSEVVFLNFTKISISIFSGVHVSFAYEPPKCTDTTALCFPASLFTKLKT